MRWLLLLVGIAIVAILATRGCPADPTDAPDAAGRAAGPVASERADAVPAAHGTSAPDSSRHRAAVEVAPKRRIEVHVEESSADFDTSHPVSGATVTVRDKATGAERTAVTDAAGVAIFEDAPMGDLLVRARAAGHYSGVDSFEVNTPVMFVFLDRGVAMEGIVLNARTGRPIEGAQIVVVGGRPYDGGPRTGLMYPSPGVEDAEHEVVWGAGVSGEGGRFRVEGIPPMCPMIVIARHRLGTASAAIWSRSIDKSQASLELRVGETGTLSGRVLDEAGKPVASALVGVAPATDHEAAGRIRDGSALQDLRFGNPPTRVVRADSEGRFRVWGLSLGEVYAVAAKGGEAPSPPADIQPTVAHPERAVDLVVTRWGRVAIRVRLPDDTPAPESSASVECWRGCGAGDPTTSTHRYDAVVPGHRTVTASAKGWPGVSTTIDVRPGELSEVTVHLTPGAAIVGLVLDAEGKPAADVEVGVFVVRPDAWWRAATMKTDAEGRFRFEGLPRGTVRFEAERGAEGGYVAAEAADGAPAARVVLGRLATISVTVVDRDGEALKNAWLEARGPVYRCGWTDDGGRCEMRVPAGRYRIAITWSVNPADPVEIDVADGATASVTLRTR